MDTVAINSVRSLDYFFLSVDGSARCSPISGALSRHISPEWIVESFSLVPLY